MRSLSWVIVQTDWFPYKRRKFRHRHIQKKDEMRTQGEEGPLQANERNWEQILSSWVLVGANPIDTLISDFHSPEL